MNNNDLYIGFDPCSGDTIPPLEFTAQGYRDQYPDRFWTHSPWTGYPRPPDFVLKDPKGFGVINPMINNSEQTPESPPPIKERCFLGGDAHQNAVPCGLESKEQDPNGIPSTEPGSKLDAGKSPVRRGLLEYFPRACMAVANVSAVGAQKYTWGGWQTVLDGVARYGDAEVRHICEAAVSGAFDKDTGLRHAAQEAWNAMARLELILREPNRGG